MSDSLARPAIATVRSEFAEDADFQELLHLFAEGIPEKQKLLRGLFRDGAIDEVRVQAHQLKGSAGGYGFPGLSATASELEQACRGRESERILRSLDAVIDYLSRIEI